jgi:hypothetical protein
MRVFRFPLNSVMKGPAGLFRVRCGARPHSWLFW